MTEAQLMALVTQRCTSRGCVVSWARRRNSRNREAARGVVRAAGPPSNPTHVKEWRLDILERLTEATVLRDADEACAVVTHLVARPGNGGGNPRGR